MTFFNPAKVRARAVDHLAVAIGTSKGLFLVSDGTVDGPFFAGEAVGAFDQVDGRFLAGGTAQGGKAVVRGSDDDGLTWKDLGPLPKAGEDDITAVSQLHVDRRSEVPRTYWVGTEPAALLRSDDDGESFTVVDGLFEHPDRPRWPAGGCGLVLHSILTDPKRPDRVVVAVSTGGVYRSEDGGETWTACNQGLESGVKLGNESGLCVHKLAPDAVNPDFFWAQTHSGIYRTEDAGDHWESVGHVDEPGGLPFEFGFPVVAHPEETATAYVVPLESEKYSCTPGRCRVYRTTNGGQNWEGLSDGLPGTDAYLTVLRDALTIGAMAPYPIVFGSKSGHVFASQDGGDYWRVVTSYLPPVLCVRVLD